MDICFSRLSRCDRINQHGDTGVLWSLCGHVNQQRNQRVVRCSRAASFGESLFTQTYSRKCSAFILLCFIP